MIAAALEDEVEEFIQQHLKRKDAEGHRLVVRNGYMSERQIMATCGNITIRQPRIADSHWPEHHYKTRYKLHNLLTIYYNCA